MAALTCWAWMTCETSCQLGVPRTLGVPRVLTLYSCQPATHAGLARRWLPPVCAMLCAWRWRARCLTALPWSLHGTQAPAFHGQLPPQAHESLLAVWCDLCRQFYTALAVGDTVQAAFEIGKQSVKTAPHVPNSHLESDKFLLLPKVCCAMGCTSSCSNGLLNRAPPVCTQPHRVETTTWLSSNGAPRCQYGPLLACGTLDGACQEVEALEAAPGPVAAQAAVAP